MNEPSNQEEAVSWDYAPSLSFQNNKVKNCMTCSKEPTYEEMKKLITCKSTVECVDEKQWEQKKYRKYRV